MGYTAIVLNEESHKALLNAFDVPSGWEVKAHHMTINMGSPESGPASHLIGQIATLKAVSFAGNDKVLTVKVESQVPTVNATAHVTIAVNKAAGAKAVMSNEFSAADYKAIAPIELVGLVSFIKK